MKSQVGGAVVSAPPRNAVAFLTLFTVLNDMRLRARGGDFALCGARPKGSALWKLAALKGWRTFFSRRLRRLRTRQLVRKSKFT
ncbi:MAG: hypothetical protein K2J11_04175 [Oscillospiraceae bacterium]|nr:hypothetical protein [Oscillospiraceae bacterium]